MRPIHYTFKLSAFLIISCDSNLLVTIKLGAALALQHMQDCADEKNSYCQFDLKKADDLAQ